MMKRFLFNPIALCLVLLGLGIGVYLSATGQFVPGMALEDRPFLVEARGKERAWRFSYAGSDGKLGTADDWMSAGELRVPVDTDVVLRLHSEDFIYVFSCPDLNLKEIAVPDLKFTLSFKIEQEADFDLAMDPMCGFQLPPGKTMGTLIACSETSFNRWLGELSNKP